MIIPSSNTMRLVLILFYLLLFFSFKVDAKCRSGCNLAIASYNIWEGTNLTYISHIFGKKISEILSFNPNIQNPNMIWVNTRVNIPFPCECLNGDFLGHTFTYKTEPSDTYVKIAEVVFANLTTIEWIQTVNVYDPTRIPVYVPVNVTVNCSCGDGQVSMDYGLFATYPLQPGEDLWSVAAESGVEAELLRSYNMGSDYGNGSGILFVPAKG
ncbi:hypothetical protein CsSME_00032622 [Camellia sinensis var. sinensis]